MLLRKQTAFQQRFQAVLDFQPSKEGYEAGIVLWWSLFSYASIGITVVSGKRVLVLRLPTETIGVMSVS